MSLFRPRRPSPALIVSCVALIVAMGGTSYAAFTLPARSVGMKQLKKGAVTTSKIKNGAVTKSKINTTGLTVPNALHANNADTASNAASAANALQLGGVSASGYTRNDCSSNTGQIKGFAMVNASSTFSSTYTTTGVSHPYSCSGGTVVAKHVSAGQYDVKFNGSPAVLAVASEFETSGDQGPELDTIGVSQIGPGEFRVGIWNDPTKAFIDDPFVILTP